MCNTILEWEERNEELKAGLLQKKSPKSRSLQVGREAEALTVAVQEAEALTAGEVWIEEHG